MRKGPYLIILILTVCLFIFNISVYAETAKYNLPYPGILPDHIFYPIKAGRDWILDWSTADSLKRAKLYLLFSDKRASMARELSKKGKWQLAATTISKGEKYFLKIPDILQKSKKSDWESVEQITIQARTANKKHREIIETFIKKAPKANVVSFQKSLELNKKINDMLK